MIHTLTFEMPRMYEPPLGTHLYWRAETSGVLSVALWAYILHGAEPDTYPAPTPEQLQLAISYLRYVIGAPCWTDGGSGALATLREQAATLATVAEVDAWIAACVEIGIDPL